MSANSPQPPAQSINSQRLLDRFLRYVQIPSAANPQSVDYPSSPGQWELGRLLVAELAAMGASQVAHDEHGLVWATLTSPQDDAPTVLLNAHLDTSPEAPDRPIRAQVIRDYSGGAIPLGSSGLAISDQNSPTLVSVTGHTLIVTDGTTLLGGDDKAGVAVIMELCQMLLENPQLPRPNVRILLTCDEELGRGAQHVNPRQAAALVGYTLDGGGACRVENETFSADLLEVSVLGYNVHPGIASGRMINAARGLGRLLAELPSDRLTPETTSDKQGFLHLYHVGGGVGQAEAKVLLRDFDSAKLDEYAHLVEQAADRVRAETPGLKIEIVRQAQYRNMAEYLEQLPEAVEFALQAHRLLGREPELAAIRGGTDGAQFSAQGLPTPNLSVGQHNIHSVTEFASLTEMGYALQHLLQLLGLWASDGRHVRQ